ncbi:hypothetical protein [Thermocoleostomius sinensis]|jgi:hypothetical protein|uniref:DUF1269 domain-containing protein n=1 Tax=Thermocoleostomius sinensis A174 TaxID=2016057 RepID=A0A9E8Z9Y9_9CYAN|nr:hypothetical protein [Thermocoleostomius sinensis]WAL58109.1 hypothetical protein OXH18_12980 [Thermocoleostomius sinensis A174]
MANPDAIASSSESIGEFFTKNDIDAAKAALQEAGFSDEQIILQAETPEPNQPVQETKAVESAKGGAIIGTLFGGLSGLLIGAITSSLPGGSVSFHVNPIAMALAGSAIGAFGFTLIGVASGVNAPQTQSVTTVEPSYKYNLRIRGGEENVRRAAEVLRQKGIQQ